MSIHHSTNVLAAVKLPEFPKSESDQIPFLAHISWKDANIPVDWQETVHNWRRLHPTWRVHLWTDLELHVLVVRRFPHLLQVYSSFQYNIQRCDFSRALLLYEYGGIYADLDICPVRGLDPFIVFHNDMGHEVVMAQSAVAHGLLPPPTNAFMLSQPKSNFWLTYIDIMTCPDLFQFPGKAVINKSRHFAIITSTGPQALAYALSVHKQKHPLFSYGYISNTLVQYSPHWEKRPTYETGAPVKLLPGGSWHHLDSKLVSQLDYAWTWRNTVFGLSIGINIVLWIWVVALRKRKNVST